MIRASDGLPIDIARLEQILEQACGVALSVGLRRALTGSFSRAAEAFGQEAAGFAAQLEAGDPEAVSCLVEHSVVGETYFFRHPEHFEALRRWLDSARAPAGALRIWSAGCASGEEPYSLAMALLEMGRREDRILATDVSRRALRLAGEARYGAWSMRRLSEDLRGRFFTPDGDRVRVVDAPRARVEFKLHNLVTEPPPIADCDLVLCRNVLIYFTPETAARVLHKVAGALKPGGILILGPVELPNASILAMEWIDSGDGAILRKPQALAPVRPIAAKLTPQRRYTRACPEPRRPGIRPEQSEPKPAHVGEGLFESAREAARRGELDLAEQLAKQCAAVEMLPEAYLLLSIAAETRGQLPEAVDAARRALYLEPTLATGHATLVALFTRMGQPEEAERARRNALHALEDLDDAALLRGVEAITVSALRRALERPGGGRSPTH